MEIRTHLKTPVQNSQSGRPTLAPLIKWPGGKTQEFALIQHLIPKHERYIEPFFGGGAVFFQLRPSVGVINDVSRELIDFYRFIKGDLDKESLKKELYAYVDVWERIPEVVSLFEPKLVKLYEMFRADGISDERLKDELIQLFRSKENLVRRVFTEDFCEDQNNLFEQFKSNLFSKITRTRDVERMRGSMQKGDLEKNLETAFRSGFYMHFRDLLNKSGSLFGELPHSKKIATYYFIREFCYGSMFRYNAVGHFNIPYGGIAYNTKNFRGKVDRLFSEEVGELFSGAEIYNDDFETVLSGLDITAEDFMFIDPPYDTEFSDYDKNIFNKKDQIRLANYLLSTKGKFLLLIKNTPFIMDLYKSKLKITIDYFNKTYMYNMRGRNERDTEHLVIKNY